MNPNRWTRAAAVIACAFWGATSQPQPARACGGFFCSASPVDQNAERIVFAIDEQNDRTDMIVQISYQGRDDAFAWVLPVGAVPETREVFPNGALAPLDAQTGPSFQPPAQCRFVFPAASGGITRASSPPEADGVIVHVQETVGPFDVVVIESASADSTFQWLVTNGYRLSSVMKPYIAQYTAQKMKFLALKLTANASVRDIQPFKLRLPGTTPTIPLRLTAIAAEPEMSLVVWILGQRRYEPANAEEIQIPQSELRWKPYGFPIQTNWTQLVARHVDAVGGRGWVVEQAGPSASVVQFLQNSGIRSPEQELARTALLKLFEGRPYMTRLYTRVAAEEMSYDPSFRRSEKPDVSRTHELPYIAEICSPDGGVTPWSPCDFATCGQLGLCRPIRDAASNTMQAGCACAPGSTARTTFDVAGAAIVSCQDQRMSFMNPGDRDESGNVFADPCVNVDCGGHGKCIAMNLTPTCECAQGYVAVGSVDANGVRRTTCQLPTEQVPTAFYNRRPPQLAPGMMPGREITLQPATGKSDVPIPYTYGNPQLSPESTPSTANDGCSLRPVTAHNQAGLWLSLLGTSWFLGRRRRRHS